MFTVTAVLPVTWYLNLFSGRDAFSTTRDDLPSTMRPEDLDDRLRAALAEVPSYDLLALVAVLTA